ncbi:hypothetical protein ACVBIL_17290 [Shewanella sp. 125m-7]
MAKSAIGQSVIQQRGEMNTLSLLILFLLSIASFTFGSLYFESQHKNKLLSSEVQKLKNSQVLLMVPDEQAEVMANWMAENPHFVQSFVDKAKQGESTVLPIGPGINQAEQAQTQRPKTQRPYMSTDVQQVSNKTVSASSVEKERLNNQSQLAESATKNKVGVANNNNNNTSANNLQQPKSVKVNEREDGVKLISLPHGGIRVTTREPEE